MGLTTPCSMCRRWRKGSGSIGVCVRLMEAEMDMMGVVSAEDIADAALRSFRLSAATCCHAVRRRRVDEDR